jgi:hypothetical protein
MMNVLRRHLVRLARLQGGQAMAEYSMTTFALLVGTGGFLLTGFMPTFLNAFNSYLHGFQIIFNLPIP